MRLLLASASPRRLELLAQIGIVPDEVRPAEVDETPRQGELPRQYCRRMALEKSLSIEPGDGRLVLAADTVAALGRSVLGKPVGEEEAEIYLRRLSGRRHQVVTAIALAAPGKLLQREVVSIVRMKRLTPNEIAEYLQSGEWRGKAGGYGIQGAAGAFIPWISGSYSSIAGLPLAETSGLLRAAGYTMRGGR